LLVDVRKVFELVDVNKYLTCWRQQSF